MFPKYKKWIGIIHKDDEDKKDKLRYNYYKHKYNICKKYMPKAIAEIGVRYGYSAYSFLCACPKARYYGIDCFSSEHGGVGKDTFDYVYELLEPVSDANKITLLNVDTQSVTDNPIGSGGYDFVHIDGDHTYNGCLHDMELMWGGLQSGGIMVVDDYRKACIRGAIVSFLNKYDKAIKKYYQIQSFRGDFVLEKE